MNSDFPPPVGRDLPPGVGRDFASPPGGRGAKLAEQPERSTPAALLVGLIIVAVGAAALAHWPALASKALFSDDRQYLLDNYLVQKPSWASAGRFLNEVRAPSTVDGYYQPLAMISLMLDCAMGGSPENLAPFHRTSLALHLANTALVVVLLYLLLAGGGKRGQAPRGAPFSAAPTLLCSEPVPFCHSAWAAGIAGLLFGVHPMAVEPIAWVGERKTLLATFFALWSLVTYVRYARTGRWAWYVAAACAFVLALMSKPTVTMLPLLMLLLDFWPLRRLNGRAVLEKLPLIVIAGVSAGITYVSQKATAGVYDPTVLSPWRIPLILCHNLVFYPRNMLWPVGLSSYYPFPEPMSLSHPVILAGVVAVPVLLVLLVASLRWTRAAVVGWAFFFLAILPTMHLIGFTVTIAYDKYAYFPAIGFLLALAALVAWIWRDTPAGGKSGPLRGAVLAVALLAAGLEIVATRGYLRHWRDSESLVQYMLRQTPNEAYLHDTLGTILAREGRFDEAVQQHAEALELKPFYADAHYNLGNALASRGRYQEAIECYREAVKINPRFAEAEDNLAVALVQTGKLDEAAQHSAEALRLNPANPRIRVNLAGILTMQGKLDEAVRHYIEALRLYPAYTDARISLAATFARQGKLDEAVQQFERAIHINPTSAKAHKGLGLALEQQGKTEAALREYREALRLNPQDEGLRSRLGERSKP